MIAKALKDIELGFPFHSKRTCHALVKLLDLSIYILKTYKSPGGHILSFLFSTHQNRKL